MRASATFSTSKSDRVAQNVTHFASVPIKASDFIHLMVSIYDDRIYSTSDGMSCMSLELDALQNRGLLPLWRGTASYAKLCLRCWRKMN